MQAWTPPAAGESAPQLRAPGDWLWRLRAGCARLLPPMKHLTVVRHAKSSWSQSGLPDHDRPLNDRGHRAAQAMGRFLHTTYLGGGSAEPLLPPVSKLVSSTALRALTTAQIMRETFGLPQDMLLLKQSLYLSSEDSLLNAVCEFDDAWEHVFLFGHNPGMQQLVDHLLARANMPRFPTCAVALLAFPVEHWALADWGKAQLLGHITGRLLERRFRDVYQSIRRYA